jgi:uncharacterized protein (TIGR02145 family)
MKKVIFIFLIEVTLSISSSYTQTNIFVDKRDGKTYKTLIIGNKIWMAENINFNLDNQGSYYYPQRMLNSTKKQIEEALVFYHIDKKKVKGLKGIALLKKFNPYLNTILIKYPQGWRYYNYEVSKKACPEGWHIPSKEDWVELNSYLTTDLLSKLNFDSLSVWDRDYFNPILEIRLGDYFGDIRSNSQFISSETSESIYWAELSKKSDTFYFFIDKGKKPEDMSRGAGCIRCIKDTINY